MPKAKKKYGPCSLCCTFFCGTAAILCFFFSWLMKLKLAIFEIPAYEHEWSLPAKAAAMRNAGFLYIFFTLVFLASPIFQSDVVHRFCNRVFYRCLRKWVSKENRSLLSGHRRRKGSDEDASDSELDGFSSTDRDGSFASLGTPGRGMGGPAFGVRGRGR